MNFTIESGAVVGLVGPNGAGKTTLLRCISALDFPFSGDVIIDNLSIHEHPREIHKKIGYLSDFFGLYNELTVLQCLTYVGLSRQCSQIDIENRTAELLKALGLEEKKNELAGTLSRGQRQKLAIAQSLIHQPQILLLDEPASGLDPKARFELSTLFCELQAKGTTLIVSSHILSELEDYCTDMIMLQNGKIVEQCKLETNQRNKNILRLCFSEEVAPYLESLSQLKHIKIQNILETEVLIEFNGDQQAQHKLLKELLDLNFPIFNVEQKTMKMQDVYLKHAQNPLTKGEDDDVDKP